MLGFQLSFQRIPQRIEAESFEQHPFGAIEQPARVESPGERALTRQPQFGRPLPDAPAAPSKRDGNPRALQAEIRRYALSFRPRDRGDPMGRPRAHGPLAISGMSRPRRADVLLLPVPGSPRSRCLSGERRAVACLHLLALTIKWQSSEHSSYYANLGTNCTHTREG